MIKDTISANETVTPNSKQTEVLRDTLAHPKCAGWDGNRELYSYSREYSPPTCLSHGELAD